MFLGSDVGLVDGTFVLVTDVVYEDSSVIKTNCQKSGTRRMEVKTHHTTFGGERVFGMGGILNGVKANETHALS